MQTLAEKQYFDQVIPGIAEKISNHLITAAPHQLLSSRNGPEQALEAIHLFVSDGDIAIGAADFEPPIRLAPFLVSRTLHEWSGCNERHPCPRGQS
jgi:hypothetical protein